MSFIHTALSSFFPASCVHCKSSLEDPFASICPQCLSLFEYAPCNSLDDEAVCFDVRSPVKSLYQELAKDPSKRNIKLISSFYIVKFSQMDWKFPEVVTHLPEPSPSIFKKNSFIKEVAKSIAGMLKLKYVDTYSLLIDDKVYNKSGDLMFGYRQKKENALGKQTLVISKECTDPAKLIKSPSLNIIHLF
ncbi:MAG: hypothetical protein S4CHLAM37_02260 [Chlamydiia bacterium]|nr:hypothetical protein [Chlamydiia bacterium]